MAENERTAAKGELDGMGLSGVPNLRHPTAETALPLAAEIDRQRREIAELQAKLVPEECCGKYDTCEKRCVHLVHHMRWKVRQRETEIAELRATDDDARRWQKIYPLFVHQHRGDSVGWTLDVLLPGNSPNDAIDELSTS